MDEKVFKLIFFNSLEIIIDESYLLLESGKEMVFTLCRDPYVGSCLCFGLFEFCFLFLSVIIIIEF